MRAWPNSAQLFEIMSLLETATATPCRRSCSLSSG